MDLPTSSYQLLSYLEAVLSSPSKDGEAPLLERTQQALLKVQNQGRFGATTLQGRFCSSLLQTQNPTSKHKMEGTALFG